MGKLKHIVESSIHNSDDNNDNNNNNNHNNHNNDSSLDSTPQLLENGFDLAKGLTFKEIS